MMTFSHKDLGAVCDLNHPTHLYALQVVEGKRMACKWEKLSCEHHLKDLLWQGTDDFPYMFDETRADRIFRWFAVACVHVRGVFTGKTIKFLPIPMGVKAESMDMKLSDAEFTELNKLNALQIASAFGIKPNILNNYEKSSYSNSETQQLDFYINSLMPILKHYREEMTRKLLYRGFLEHDNKELFKLDPVKQMTVLKQGMNNFMYTINDVREELGKPYIDHPKANLPMGNGNYITLDQVGEQQKGAKISETTEPSEER